MFQTVSIANGATVSYSDNSIVSVINVKENAWTMKALKVGTATVKFTISGDGGYLKEASFKVNVKAASGSSKKDLFIASLEKMSERVKKEKGQWYYCWSTGCKKPLKHLKKLLRKKISILYVVVWLHGH